MSTIIANSFSRSASLVVELGQMVESDDSWWTLAPIVKSAVTAAEMIFNTTRDIDGMYSLFVTCLIRIS